MHSGRTVHRAEWNLTPATNKALVAFILMRRRDCETLGGLLFYVQSNDTSALCSHRDIHCLVWLSIGGDDDNNSSLVVSSSVQFLC